MKSGRPRKIRLRKRFKRNFGAAKRGAQNPKQKAATVGRNRVRRRKRVKR